MGPGACELGRTWGYDESGIWVAEGCSGEFALGGQAPKFFGRYTPTQGFEVADTEAGSMTRTRMPSGRRAAFNKGAISSSIRRRSISTAGS
jgi:hypothetical protein